MALLQWHMVYKFSEDELHRPPVVALNSKLVKSRPSKDSRILWKRLEFSRLTIAVSNHKISAFF